MADPSVYPLTLESLDVIAPFSMLIGADETLRHVGPGLARACPELTIGAQWSRLFTAATPGMELSLPDLTARVGTSFELRNRAGTIRWLGTVLPVDGQSDLLLVGTPQFADAESLAASGLTELDFAPGDPTFALFARFARGTRHRPMAPPGLIEEVQLERLTGIPGKTHGSLAADLLDVFATRFDSAMAALRAAIAAADPERVRQEAHALKGAALTVGAAAVGELCAHIEQDARDGSVAHGTERCDGLDARWAESAPFLWTIVDRRGSTER